MIIEPQTLALFLPACFAMNLTIGPNNLMVMSNGARHGPRAASIAVLGRLVGQTILISVSAAGLATLLLGSALAFNVVKTIGALWLLVIAWRLWHAPPTDGSGAGDVDTVTDAGSAGAGAFPTGEASRTVEHGTSSAAAVRANVAPDVSLHALARDEFLVALVNPKAILIFTAFLPQFVDPTRPVAAQFAVVGGLFLVLEWIAAAGYAVLGARLSRWLRTARNRLRFQRANATLLALAALGLLVMRGETSGPH